MLLAEMLASAPSAISVKVLGRCIVSALTLMRAPSGRTLAGDVVRPERVASPS